MTRIDDFQKRVAGAIEQPVTPEADSPLRMPASLSARLIVATDVENRVRFGVESDGVFIMEPIDAVGSSEAPSPSDYDLTDEEVDFVTRVNEVLEQATEAALNAGCAAIQMAFGVEAGDHAGLFFSDDKMRNAVAEVLHATRSASSANS